MHRLIDTTMFVTAAGTYLFSLLSCLFRVTKYGCLRRDYNKDVKGNEPFGADVSQLEQS